jgi:uncharacterized phage protein gp47/JayE
VALSVDELIIPITKDQALALLFDLLRAHGFPIASWQPGSMQRTMFEAFAELASENVLVADALARAGFNSLSSGGWLDLLSESHYDNERFEAVKTRGTVRITDTDGTGPHVIAIDEVVLSDADGHRYRNVTGGTLTLSGFLDLTFEAEVAGADSNVDNDTITVIVEGPPGATVTNPEPAPTQLWITVEGSDEETDESLRERNATKWASLAVNGPAEAYVYWSRTASPAVTRVWVDDQNPRGPGTVDVFIAGVDGAVSPSVVTAVTDYLEGTTDQVGRKGIGTLLEVDTATEHDITFAGTVYFDPLHIPAEIQGLVEAAIDAFVKLVPIGGVRSFDAETGEFLLGGLYYAVFSVPGVVNFVLTAPAANVVLARGEVATYANLSGITYEPAAF